MLQKITKITPIWANHAARFDCRNNPNKALHVSTAAHNPSVSMKSKSVKDKTMQR
jgi:hypothetical protein